jgi:hypothetical protein
MRVHISEDESAVGGGRAVVVFDPPPTGDGTVAFWSYGREAYLGARGSWQRTPHLFALKVLNDSGVVLGPDIVDHLDEDDQLRLEPNWGPAVETIWPFVPRSQVLGDEGGGVWVPKAEPTPPAVGPIATALPEPSASPAAADPAPTSPPAAVVPVRIPRRFGVGLLAALLLLTAGALAAAAFFVPQIRDPLFALVPREFLCEQLGLYCTEVHEPRIADLAIECASRTVSACDASQACFSDYERRFPEGGPSRLRLDTRRRELVDACARARNAESEHQTFLACLRTSPCDADACRTRYRVAAVRNGSGERDVTASMQEASRICLDRSSVAYESYGVCLEATPCESGACRRTYEEAVPERLRREVGPLEGRARDICLVIGQEDTAIVQLNECRARTPSCEQERSCYAGYLHSFRNRGRRTQEIEEALRATREACRRDTEVDRSALMALQTCAARNQCELGSCRSAFEGAVPLVRRALISRLSDQILENAAARCEEDRAFGELRSCSLRDPCGFSACLATYERVQSAEGRGSRYLQVEALQRGAQIACIRSRDAWRLSPGRYRFERRFSNIPEQERRARRCFPVELIVTVSASGDVAWVDREVGRHSEWRGTLTNPERGEIQVTAEGVRTYGPTGEAQRVSGRASGNADQMELHFEPCGRGTMRLLGPAN